MNIKEHYEISATAWKYFRKYAEQLPLSDDQWNSACKEMIDICNQYGKDVAQFASGIMYQTMLELERLDKRMKIAEM